MSKIITVGLDLAKNVFQVHGADGAGRAVLRMTLRRTQVFVFFDQLPPCAIGMEACGGAYFLGAGLVNWAMTTALGTGQTYHQLDVGGGI